MRRREVIAAAAGAAVLALPAEALGQAASEADVVTGSLRVEHASVFTYDAVAAADLLTRAEQDRARRLRDHDAEHAEVLARAISDLGGPLPAPPRTAADVQLPPLRRGLDRLGDRDEALALLVETELASLAAHRAAITRLRDANLISLVATILATDATHLAAWRAVG